jgi:hypothetical protein
MANRSVDVDFFRCDFENTTFQEKIMSRWKTKVKLNQTMDLDGNTLNGSITSQTDDFNEVRKTKNYQIQYKTSGDSSSKDDIDHTESGLGNGTGSDTRYWLPNFESVLDDSNLTGVSVSGDSDFSRGTEPGNGDHFWIAQRAGDVTLTANLKYQLQQKICRNGVSAMTSIVFNYTWKVKHLDTDGALITTYERTTGGGDRDNWGTQNTQAGAVDAACGVTTTDQDYGLLSFDLDELVISGMSKGDRLVFYMESFIDPDGGPDWDFQHLLDMYFNSTINVQTTTAITTTSVKHYLLHDVLERMTYIVTGVQSSFYSSFFGLTDHGYASFGS